MTCSVHHCSLAECAMWAEIAALPMTCGKKMTVAGITFDRVPGATAYRLYHNGVAFLEVPA